ncbi:hypothetical protein HDV06_006253 [Boothiomyces sp. JEL0866]|nr:hypothetical protein HDV06_006253 [Boothiomyces sp. JEL0866]
MAHTGEFLFFDAQEDLKKKFVQEYTDQIGKFVTRQEFDHVMSTIHEINKMVIDNVRWYSIWLTMLILLILCFIYSDAETILMCTFGIILNGIALTALFYIGKRGLYTELALLINDLNRKYNGRIELKIREVYVGTIVTTTTNSYGASSKSSRHYMDYHLFMHGLKVLGQSISVSPPAFTSITTPTATYTPSASPTATYTPATTNYSAQPSRDYSSHTNSKYTTNATGNKVPLSK